MHSGPLVTCEAVEASRRPWPWDPGGAGGEGRKEGVGADHPSRIIGKQSGYEPVRHLTELDLPYHSSSSEWQAWFRLD